MIEVPEPGYGLKSRSVLDIIYFICKIWRARVKNIVENVLPNLKELQ